MDINNWITHNCIHNWITDIHNCSELYTFISKYRYPQFSHGYPWYPWISIWGGWGCEVSCGGHQPSTKRKTTRFIMYTDPESFAQMICELNGCPPLFVVLFSIPFFSKSIMACRLCVMWGKIMIPMYRLWLHSLYGLHGPRCPQSPERPLNLITHSLTHGYP